MHDLKLGVNAKLKYPKLFLQVDTQRRDIFISETTREVPHQLTPAEERDLRRNPWKMFPTVDKVLDGKLRLTVDRDGWSSQGGRQRDEWTDTPSRPLEHRAKVIAKEIKKGVVDDRDARERAEQARAEAIEERQRKLDEERRVWKGIQAEAWEKAIERLREAAFMDAFDAWRGARELRSFARELEVALGENGLGERARLREWLEWARQRADEMDPVVNLGKLDDSALDFKPSADELRPYMQGWDPSAPHKDYSLVYTNGQQPAPTMPERRPWHPGMQGKPSWWR
ncbi:hypothetical protein [Propionimicrobium sp. PCR01-08-3]|uniref:hypothetical protein n=1 Tax=Propionimicrobium sp. PCR01-08-3 TaxID=3052086 RepID=UPI00255CD797|nr:hypothetical protein [Propionimicrobium sp. PCR01-08-3]WIY83728.1 hypothetical protein QQ658_05110 [Propionimicrobium sp. PCR01-08-3]